VRDKKEKNYSKLTNKDFNFIRIFYQYFALYVLVLPFLLLFYRIKIVQHQKLKSNKKVIYAGNHISYLDPFLLALATRLPISFMAKKELFESKGIARQLDWLGAFAVNREKLEVSTIKTVKNIFKTNWALGIFPQGGIRKNRKIENINKGVAVIAKMAQADVVPVAITGCETYNWKLFKGKIRLEVGTAISHTLSEEEIISQWSAQIAEMTGYELVQEPEENPTLQATLSSL